MKEQTRAEPRFSLCGLNCGLCPMYHISETEHCTGCGGAGRPSCAVQRCAREHGGVEYCFQCTEYPCARYTRAEPYDSFVPHRNVPLDSDAVFSRAGRAALTELGTNTAGGCIRFRSSTGRVLVRARLAAACAMHHMPSTGQGGFDCYLRRPGGAWRYAGPSVFGHGETAYTAALWSGGDREEKEFLIHFPLYMGVKEVWVGVDADASVAAPAPRAVSGAAAVYGTSIDQGGCASHPGMAFPAILARALDVQIYNFGFSGNACLEPEMADVLARVPGLRLLVVDAVEQARAGGDANIAFLDGRTLWPDGGEEYTVDGVHPTDLGFYFMARGLLPVLLPYLTEE